MQTITREYKVYNFDELSEDAKQHALDNLRYINVEGEAWVYDDIFYYFGEEYHIKYSMKDACWDLDRGDYFYVDAKHDGSSHIAQIWFIQDNNLYKTLRKNGVRQKTINRLKDESIAISIDCKHYGGGDGKNIVDIQDYNYNLSDEDYAKLEEVLQSLVDTFCSKMVKALRNEYENATSDEAIIDTINCNEYQFTENGELFS